MARAGDGSLFYAYVDGTGNDTEVVVVHVAADGAESELPRAHAARGGLTRPTLVLDSRGDLHLAWTERADEDREVFSARYRAPAAGAPEGAGWTEITQLSSGQGYAGFPSLGATADGRVHVAWYGFDGEFYQTYYREWSNGAWAPARQLSSGPLDANNPSLVVDRDGGIHVAWYKDEGRRYSVWYAHRAPDGAWDLARRLPQGPGDALNVALAVDEAGRVHVAWDERTEDATRVMHALLDGPAISIGEGEYPAIAAWGDDVLVAWAAPDGTLMGWWGEDRTTRPLLGGGIFARHPALRGPAPGDDDPRLDVLWSQPEDDGFELSRASVGPGCSPFDKADGCRAPVEGRPMPASSGALALLACTLALFARPARPGHKG
ncbi:MAG TPA: hypothetical protein VM370_09375 [Candidatus Thermoplasmatota archaeon]|nr:hypothetical protein [Candidatus Thermoplasmatota archaeon]